MSNHVRELAQHVVDGYAKELSALDDEQIQNLVDLGDEAESIVEICDELADTTALLRRALFYVPDNVGGDVGGLHVEISTLLERIEC